MVLPVTLAAIVATICLQLWAGFALRPGRLVGDETEYLENDTEALQKRTVYVRVQLFSALVRLAQVIWSTPRQTGPRVVVSAISAVSVALATGVVETSAGSLPAIVTACVLLISVERVVLALHLWPDGVMGLLVLAIAALLPDYNAQQVIPVALLAAVGFAIRVEGAVLCLIAVLMPLRLAELPLGLAWMPVWITLGTFALLSVANGLRFGVWLPDSTISFNFSVARTELTLRNASVTDGIRHTLCARRNGAPATDAQRGTALQAIMFLAGRIRMVFCVESFVTQSLLANNRASYRNPDWLAPQRIAGKALRHSFTVSMLTLALLMPLVPMQMAALFVLMLAVYSAVLTRSRYRMALLPLAATLIGLGAAKLAAATQGQISAGLALTAFIGVILVFAPKRAERNA